MRSNPRHRARRLGLLLTLLAGVPVVMLVSWPQALGAERWPVIAHLLSFRAGLAIAFALSALLFASVALVRRRFAVAAALAVLLGVASITNAGVLLSRGISGPVPEGGLTVVAWNTQGGAASPESIARLVRETDADIVSLPETDEDSAAAVVRLLALDGKKMNADTTHGSTGYSPIPTSVLISADLGEYRIDADAGSTPGLPSAVWVPVDGTGPRIVAAHPMPPLPGLLGHWRGGLSWVADRCAVPDVIIAGDLNATIDHLSSSLGECRDTAWESGNSAAGTWPASAPVWLATPIDHVLVGSGWDVRGSSVLTSFDDAGTDHRPIIAVLDAR